MLTALAGVVHERQSAADNDNNRHEDNYHGGFHCEPPAESYQSLPAAEVPRGPKMNPSKRAGRG